MPLHVQILLNSFYFNIFPIPIISQKGGIGSSNMEDLSSQGLKMASPRKKEDLSMRFLRGGMGVLRLCVVSLLLFG